VSCYGSYAEEECPICALEMLHHNSQIFTAVAHGFRQVTVKKEVLKVLDFCLVGFSLPKDYKLMTPRKRAQVVTLLTCILEVLVSNLARVIRCPDSGCLVISLSPSRQIPG
jgi:hypothetical protein